MKLRIQTFTSLLTLIVILLAGCSGCAQKKITRETEIQAKKPVGLTSKQGVGPQRSDALPTKFYPPENPYEDITINGQAPPFEYYGNLVYWVPHMEYHNPLASDHTLPIIQDKYPTSYYRQVKRELAEKRGEALSAEEEGYIADKLYFGHLPPLDAAKCMLANGGSGSPYLLEIVQQALDENPNDFHTLLIWTEAQLQKSENREKGYRRLLQMRPNSAYVLFQLGRCIWFKNSPESIQLFKKAVQFAPNIRLGARARAKYGGERSGIHIRDWALQELAGAYFWEDEKQKAIETFNYLQQITTDEKTRERAQERIAEIKEGKRFGRITFVDDDE